MSVWYRFRTVLVLVDRSSSMDIDSRRQAVKRLLSVDQLSLLQRDFSLIKQFSSSLEPLIATIDQRPAGPNTYLVASIEEAAAAVDGSPLAGIIVLTDGVTQERNEDFKVTPAISTCLFLAPGRKDAIFHLSIRRGTGCVCAEHPDTQGHCFVERA